MSAVAAKAPIPGGGVLAVCWLEHLLGGPAGEHLFQHAAVVGVGQAAYLAVDPAVELGAAGVAAGEVRVDALGGLVVLGAERGVVLPVLFPQQDLEHYGLFSHAFSRLCLISA
jgi:hypothetical protein